MSSACSDGGKVVDSPLDGDNGVPETMSKDNLSNCSVRRGLPAVTFCTNCDILYCDDCLSTCHPNKGTFKTHQMIHMTELREHVTEKKREEERKPNDTLVPAREGMGEDLIKGLEDILVLGGDTGRDLGGDCGQSATDLSESYLSASSCLQCLCVGSSCLLCCCEDSS